MAKWITIVLAVCGLALGVYAVSTAREQPPELPLARPASVNPFGRGVAALGVVEPSARTVAVAAPEPGLVTSVRAHVSDRVAEGDVLFTLDSRQLDAQLVRARAAVAIAQAEIDRWHALPREEDLPPLEAAVARAVALREDAMEQKRLLDDARRGGAATERNVSIAAFAQAAAEAEFRRATAELAKAKAGGWRPDLVIAQAQLAAAEAEVASLEILKDRLTVRASRAGTILRRDIEPGEYARIDPTRPALILGDLTRLNVRAQVDEEDIALVAPGAKSVARTRGALMREVPLRLVRIEPFARPKTDLTGANIERVDTRVIDVLFEIDAGADVTAIYPGQALDVFIDAEERVRGAGAGGREERTENREQ